MRRVAVLGATGSIGGSALDVIARHPDRLQAQTLVAGRDVDALIALCRTHRPTHAAIADEQGYAALRDGLLPVDLGALMVKNTCQKCAGVLRHESVSYHH